MKVKKPINSNYCATVVELKNIIPLPNCDNVVHANIFGNLVIVGKDAKVGAKGLFFPPETQLSKEFLSNNNLYRHERLNIDPEKKGYFEDNGRIRTVKFRNNPSMGFFIPMNSLDFIDHVYGNPGTLKVGQEFDELDRIPICKKYIVIKKNKGMGGIPGSKAKKRDLSRIVESQFRLHADTSQLGKNLHQIKEHTIINITEKLHGTSLVSSKILCKKELKWYEKVFKKLKIPIIEEEYQNVYSSRRVIKFPKKTNDLKNSFYKEDIWGLANKRLIDFLDDGMTIYAEIVGFLSTGAYIQKDYDYGCKSWDFEIYIYRITHTNTFGKVIEMPMNYIQSWCKYNGFKAVPLLFYGEALKIWDWNYLIDWDENLSFQDNFLNRIKSKYLEMDCEICKIKKVPREGVVVRIEDMLLKAYKQKSFKFLDRETRNLDKEVVDIEEDQEIFFNNDIDESIRNDYKY